MQTEKFFNPLEVSNVKRDLYGFVSQFEYRGRIWSKKELKRFLGEDVLVRYRAFELIFQNHETYEEIRPGLTEAESKWMLDENDFENGNFLFGFHPRHSHIYRKLANLRFSPEDVEKVVEANKEILPQYINQIWNRTLSNLSIRYRVKPPVAFMTRRKRKKKV